METQDANCDEEAIKCSKLVEEEEEQSCFDYMTMRVLWKEINNRDKESLQLFQCEMCCCS